jgi:hypothetical protein
LRATIDSAMLRQNVGGYAMTQIKLHPLERVFVEQVIGGQVGRRDLAAAAGFTRITENGVR